MNGVESRGPSADRSRTTHLKSGQSKLTSKGSPGSRINVVHIPVTRRPFQPSNRNQYPSFWRLGQDFLVVNTVTTLTMLKKILDLLGREILSSEGTRLTLGGFKQLTHLLLLDNIHSPQGLASHRSRTIACEIRAHST